MPSRRAFGGLLVGPALWSATDGHARSMAPTPQKRVDPLPHPAGRRILVAVVLDEGTELTDFAGPWGVFEHVSVEGAEGSPFSFYTVSDATKPLRVSGGLTVTPDHSYTDAPLPRLILVPALGGPPSEALLQWLRRTAPQTDLTFSVCNGVFALAPSGLLNGTEVTGHHGAYALLAADFPEVRVRRGARYVDNGRLATSGGLTSGIDLALHIVERYFGRAVAERTAKDLEYQGSGWRNADSNTAFARKPKGTRLRPVCPVCESAFSRAHGVTAHVHGKEVALCSDACRERFARSPERFP